MKRWGRGFPSQPVVSLIKCLDGLFLPIANLSETPSRKSIQLFYSNPSRDLEAQPTCIRAEILLYPFRSSAYNIPPATFLRLPVGFLQ